MITLGTAALLVMAACNGEKKNKADANNGANAESPAPAQQAETPETSTYSTQQVMQAALNGQLQRVEDAVESGLDVNATDEEMHTPIMLAAYNGHVKVVEYLLDHGATVDAKDGTDRTALMYASTGPFNETVKLLLEAGADPNLVDNNEHFSALMFAAAEGQAEVVKTLLAHGADKSLEDVDGDTAYDFATNNGHTAVAELVK